MDLKFQIQANRLVHYFSIGLFILSLTQPCFCTDNECQGIGAGFWILIFGPLGCFLCPAGYSWLANPVLFISWLNYNKKPKTALIASIIALVFAASFLFFHQIISYEGGIYHTITGYKIGYWLWLSSSATMLIGNIISRYMNPTVNKSKAD